MAYIAALSKGLGQRWATYTSPHILHFNERITIMGEPVSTASLVEAFEQVEQARSGVSLTYFEFTTLAALLIMSQSDLDCAVLEVGLGGRLDAVNLVDTDCAVITPIGLDHQDFLGSDLASIAHEKAGIIRADAPVVCTEEHPPVAVLNRASALGARAYLRGTDFDLNTIAGSSSMHFEMGGQTFRVPLPPMGGEHQFDNLAAALAATLLLNPEDRLDTGDMDQSIRHCSLPGRLQLLGSDPCVLLDVGHNELAADSVAKYLAGNNQSSVSCVLAMLADKPAERVAQSLSRVCTSWWCADTPGERGQSGEILASRIRAVLPSAQVENSGPLAGALEMAIASSGVNDVVLVFGSFAAVSQATSWLGNSMQRPPLDAARIN